LEVPYSIHRQLLLCNILSLTLAFCQQTCTASVAADCGDKDAISVGLVSVFDTAERPLLCVQWKGSILFHTTYVRAYEREWMDVGNVKIETAD